MSQPPHGDDAGDPTSPNAIETTLVHAGSDPHRQQGFINPPLYRGSTVLYESTQAMEATAKDPLKRTLPAYGRFGTPTVRAFESAMCELEGGSGAVCASSGLAAITTAILAFVEAGDHLLVTESVYSPTRSFCETLRRLGVETEYYDPCIGGDIAALLRDNTRLVLMESPGSATFEVQDVPAIASACRARGVVTIVDNTWATPLFLRPLALGANVVVHSASKYITGHCDNLLGVIVCDEASYGKVRTGAIRTGQCAGVDDAYAGLRGLRTLAVRLEQHQRQALSLATWLQGQPEVAEVIHPALPGDAGHRLWKRDFRGATGLFGIVLQPQYDRASVSAMLDGLRLFGLGHSYGGFESLLVPAEPAPARRPGPWQRRGALLRVHVGLEHVGDLERDLRAALRRLAK